MFASTTCIKQLTKQEQGGTQLPFNNHSFPEHYRCAYNLQIWLHIIIKPTWSLTAATTGGSSLPLPLHGHSFNPRRSCSQSYTGINWPLQEKGCFFWTSSLEVHLPASAIHGRTGEGRKLTWAGVCNLLSGITDQCTMLLNRVKWISKEACVDICLEFTTLLLSSYMDLSMPWLAGLSTTAIMMGQLTATWGGASALHSIRVVLN